MLQYSEIKESLLAIKMALEGDAQVMALDLVNKLLERPEFHGVSIVSVIGLEDVRRQLDGNFIVNGASSSQLDELAEASGEPGCAETISELAESYLDKIQTPADFLTEYPAYTDEVPSVLIDTISSWIEELPVEDGKISTDFLYWKKGTDFIQITDWFDYL